MRYVAACVVLHCTHGMYRTLHINPYVPHCTAAVPQEVESLDIVFYAQHLQQQAAAATEGDQQQQGEGGEGKDALAGVSRLPTLIDIQMEFAAPYGELRKELAPLKVWWWCGVGGGGGGEPGGGAFSFRGQVGGTLTLCAGVGACGCGCGSKKGEAPLLGRVCPCCSLLARHRLLARLLPPKYVLYIFYIFSSMPVPPPSLTHPTDRRPLLFVCRGNQGEPEEGAQGGGASAACGGQREWRDALPCMPQLLLLLLRTTNSSARGCWRCDKKSKQNE